MNLLAGHSSSSSNNSSNLTVMHPRLAGLLPSQAPFGAIQFGAPRQYGPQRATMPP